MLRTVFLSFLLMTGCATTQAPRQIDNAYFEDLFDTEFFVNSQDPFQEMHRITTELSSQNENPVAFNNAFNVWYWEKHGRYLPELIHYQEDDKTFTVTLDLEDGDNPTVNLRIDDDVLILTGELIRKTQWTERRIKLNQKLPLPSGLDPLSVFSWKNGLEYIIRIEKLDG